MYVRYIVPKRDEESHQLAGIFQAAYELRDQAVLDASAQSTLDSLLKWFRSHLPIPDRFSRSRRPRAHPNAICWMKEGSVQHFNKMRAIASLLDLHGVSTRILRTDRPGYVVYEDEYQIVAVPFQNTGA
jgi:hypothetical protein